MGVPDAASPQSLAIGIDHQWLGPTTDSDGNLDSARSYERLTTTADLYQQKATQVQLMLSGIDRALYHGHIVLALHMYWFKALDNGQTRSGMLTELGYEWQSQPKSIEMLRVIGDFMLMNSRLMSREPHIFYDSLHLKMV